MYLQNRWQAQLQSLLASCSQPRETLSIAVITHWNVATWRVSVFKEILRILYTCGTTECDYYPRSIAKLVF